MYPTLGNSIIAPVQPSGQQQSIKLSLNAPYDLDLINQRSYLEGTLNFVIPPEITSQARINGGLIIRSIVEPVGRSEAISGDNSFVLQLRKVAPSNPLNIDLVRVQIDIPNGNHYPPPSLTDARNVLNSMLKITPYDKVNIVRNSVFVYDGQIAKIARVISLANQCNSLWYKLYREFGVTSRHTVFG